MNSAINFFFNKEYLDTQSNENGILNFEGYRVAYYIKRKGIFSKLCFTSPIVSETGEGIALSEHTRVLDGLIELIRALNVDYIAQPMAHVFFDCIPKGAIGIKWSSPVVSLEDEPDDILSAMHQKHRNVIRKAGKSNVCVDFNTDVEVIHKLISSTMKKQGRSAVSLSILRSLKDHCGKNVFFVSCKIDNMLQGVAVIPYDKNKGYYLYGGSSLKTMPGALNYMHYKIMLKLKSLNISSYDLMGYRLAGTNDNKIIGIQRFKTRFGATLEDGYTWKYILNPKKYKVQVFLFKLKGFLQRKPYLGDIIDQGQ